MARATRGDSIASNMMVFTLMIVTASITIVSLAALTGVYDLARGEASAQHEAVRNACEIEIEDRLTAASRVVEQASRAISNPPQETIDSKTLALAFDGGIEYVDQLTVVYPDGEVHTSFPELPPDVSVNAMPAFVMATPEISFDFSGIGENGELWVSRSVEGPDGSFVVLARARTTFLPLITSEFSLTGDGRVVYLVGSDDEILFAGRPMDDATLDSLAYEAFEDAPAQGSVSASTDDGITMWGEYSTIEDFSGLGWRIAVIEPRSVVVSATWGALQPAVLALVISGVMSFALAALFARRLVRPLKTLETHARDAISGAYVPQMHSERQDEVGRLAEAFNAMALRLNALQDLSQLLASSSSVDQVLDGILNAIGHIVGSAKISVMLVDDLGASLQVVRSRGLESSEQHDLVLSRHVWLAEALESDGPKSFEGWRADVAAVLPGLDSLSPISGLVAPLVAGAEPLGVIVVAQTGRRSFSEAELEMVRTFSAQAAVAVYNSRLFEFESSSRQEAEAMRAVAEALANPLDVQGSFDTVLSIAQTLFDVASAQIVFMNRAELLIPAPEDIVGERRLLSAWDAAWSAGDGDLVMRVAPGDDPAIDRYLESIGAEEALFISVMRAQQPGAVVSLAMVSPERMFTAHERSLAYSLGKQLALALDNAYHYAEARYRATNLETIFRISQAVSSSLQIKVVLNRVLDVVQKILTADTVSLMQYNESLHVIETVMARGMISTEILHLQCERGEDIPGRVFDTGEPVRIDDMVSMETELAVVTVKQGLHSMLSVPLLARGRSIGVLSVYSATRAAFSDEDMGLLHTFASQAALAIDTAELFSREHHVSKVLQGSILPQSLPEYLEVESSSVYLPAGEGVEIGGDYFDLFKDDAGRVVLAIGDVCGKGVEAATKTSMIKYMVRGLVAAGLGPAATISEVNQAVSESGEPTDIVTLWVGFLDTQEQTLLYADGGHPPALIRRDRTGDVERLDTTGALLGAIPEAEYEEVSLPFEPGDLIVLYTDGVTEARRGNKFFGEGRVRRAVGAGGTPNDVVDRLLGSLDRFVPGTLRDDAAVLSVRLNHAPKDEDSIQEQDKNGETD